jgi:hypothetical protein
LNTIYTKRNSLNNDCSNCAFGFLFGENVMSKFNYRAPAELFPSRNRKSRQPVKYRRFETAAHAIQFAMEELPPLALLGAFIEIDEARLGHVDIRELYESPDYPLKKQAMNETIARATASDA